MAEETLTDHAELIATGPLSGHSRFNMEAHVVICLFWFCFFFC